jgi:hypothetical protein
LNTVPTPQIAPPSSPYAWYIPGARK